MKLYIYIAIFCIIVFLYQTYYTEYFENVASEITPDILEKYKKFVLFYQAFLQSWEKAIITSIGLELPIKPLDSPSSTSSSTPPTPSRNEINAYISTLSKKLEKPLPPVTDPLPSEITSISVILPLLPKEPAPFKNALDWMNKNMADSHAQLEKSLKGEGFIGEFNEGFLEQFETLDNFEDICKKMIDCQEKFEGSDSICEKIKQCKQEQIIYDKKQLSDLLDKFLMNDELLKASALNIHLVEESKKIENQAKSGELLNKMNLPQEDTIKYNVPSGGDKLAQMQKNDPSKYKRLQSEGGSLFSLKQLMEQINGNLR